VSSALKKVDGVKDVKIDTKRATATIVYDDAKTNVDALSKVLEDKGFPPKGKPRFMK
jgi:mercuric ion binding protein